MNPTTIPSTEMKELLQETLVSILEEAAEIEELIRLSENR